MREVSRDISTTRLHDGLNLKLLSRALVSCIKRLRASPRPLFFGVSPVWTVFAGVILNVVYYLASQPCIVLALPPSNWSLCPC